MLMLCADDDVPRGIAAFHIGCLVHLLVVVVLFQTIMVSRKCHVRAQGTARAETEGMSQASGTTSLARPRVVHVPQRLPLRHIGHLVFVVVDKAREPHGESAGFCGGHIQFETQVLIIERFILHIDGMQFLGYFKETIPVVDQVGCLRPLAQRTFGGEVYAQSAYLHGMLILHVVATAHLHIKGTREGIAKLSRHGSREEVAVGQHRAVERGKDTATCFGDFGEVIGVVHLHTLHTPLQHLR